MGFTARIKLLRPEHSTDIISEVARQEFIMRWQGESVRSVNITAGKIVSQEHEQLELFFEGEEKKHAIDRVVDDLRKRFGKIRSFMLGRWLVEPSLDGRIIWADIKEKVNDVKRTDCRLSSAWSILVEVH